MPEISDNSVSTIQSGGEKSPEFVINPVRSEDYEMRPATGFMVRGLGSDSFLLDPFIDLPPVRTLNVNDKRSPVIDRKFTGGFLMSRDELRNLGQRLMEAADQKPQQA